MERNNVLENLDQNDSFRGVGGNKNKEKCAPHLTENYDILVRVSYGQFECKKKETGFSVNGC